MKFDSEAFLCNSVPHSQPRCGKQKPHTKHQARSTDIKSVVLAHAVKLKDVVLLGTDAKNVTRTVALHARRKVSLRGAAKSRFITRRELSPELFPSSLLQHPTQDKIFQLGSSSIHGMNVCGICGDGLFAFFLILPCIINSQLRQ